MQQLDLGYPFSAQKERPKLKWPRGNRVAVIFHMPLEHWVPVEGESGMYSSIMTPSKSHAQAPDLVTYLSREFGHRVGIWRLMKMFDKFRIKPSCPLNVEFARIFPTIMKEVKRRGWELAAHAYTQNDRMTKFTGSRENEREFIIKNLADFERIVGTKSEGWVSPGVTPTIHTGKIVAEEGIKFYCDYQNDDQPYLISSGGRSTVCVPYSNELGDYTLYLKYHYAPHEVFSIIKEHFDYIYSEGREQAKLMHISMHPHVSGQASKIRTLERAIKYFRKHEKVWFATRVEVANWYLESTRKVA
jgi:allantoinase